MIKFCHEVYLFCLIANSITSFYCDEILSETIALDLANRREFVERIIYWRYNSDSPTVNSEAARLLAWLIKNCHSSDPFTLIVSIPNSVKCLVEMIASNHTVMQNEALLALCLICARCLKSQLVENTNNANPIDENEKDNYLDVMRADHVCLDELLIDSEIGKHLTFIVNKYFKKMDKEIVENLLVLLDQISGSLTLLKHLRETCVGESLKLLAENPDLTNIKNRLECLVIKLN